MLVSEHRLDDTAMAYAQLLPPHPAPHRRHPPGRSPRAGRIRARYGALGGGSDRGAQVAARGPLGHV